MNRSDCRPLVLLLLLSTLLTIQATSPFSEQLASLTSLPEECAVRDGCDEQFTTEASVDRFDDTKTDSGTGA